MEEVYPKLHEYAEMDASNPKLNDLYFDSFAEQVIRAGSMSYADWEYPLRNENPYEVFLPDVQSQRQLIGRGMTGWVKQRIAKGETNDALRGIRAQLAGGRHCAATPVLVCHIIGTAITNQGLDNLELTIQLKDCPNLYWSLSKLPPTLQELGPMLRWELWAAPTRLNEPLPPVGDDAWRSIAQKFVETFSTFSEERYTPEEAAELQGKMVAIAKQALPKSLSFTAAEIEQMSKEELIMRWIYMNYCRFRSQVEPLAFQSPVEVIKAKKKIERQDMELLAATGAKASPYPVSLPTGILACRNFERRVKFLQTIEALRDYASRHDGEFPKDLSTLEVAAPSDPFTNEPFSYQLKGTTARIWQVPVEGLSSPLYDYDLSIAN